MNNEELIKDAKCAALQVEFLTTNEELFLYAGAIYSAMKWGRDVNKKNPLIGSTDSRLK